MTTIGFFRCFAFSDEASTENAEDFFDTAGGAPVTFLLIAIRETGGLRLGNARGLGGCGAEREILVLKRTMEDWAETAAMAEQ